MSSSGNPSALVALAPVTSAPASTPTSAIALGDYGLTIEVRHEPGHVLVTVAGEVDIATVPPLQERLAALAASGRPLIVDLDRVTFIDASGLGALASAASRAAQRESSLQVVCVRHLVRRLFTITGLDRQIPLARTVAEARHSLVAAWDTPVNGHRQHAPCESSMRPAGPDLRPV